MACSVSCTGAESRSIAQRYGQWTPTRVAQSSFEFVSYSCYCAVAAPHSFLPGCTCSFPVSPIRRAPRQLQWTRLLSIIIPFLPTLPAPHSPSVPATSLSPQTPLSGPLAIHAHLLSPFIVALFYLLSYLVLGKLRPSRPRRRTLLRPPLRADRSQPSCCPHTFPSHPFRTCARHYCYPLPSSPLPLRACVVVCVGNCNALRIKSHLDNDSVRHSA